MEETHVIQTEFWFDFTKVGHGACTRDARVQTIPDGNQGGTHVLGSGGELVDDYIKNPTNYRALLNRIRPLHRPPDLPDILRTTYEYTQFAIELSGAHGDVGGDIDQVHLGRGGVEWIHGKQNCGQ